MTRVLIVDDELPARERLQRLLGGLEGVCVCGEAGDGVAAIEQIRELRPDVVLLDIEMPGCRGTEVAASLPEPRPHIIFCTAYDNYAVEAFELRAVDYLLKPVTRSRLEQALAKTREAAPKLPPPQRFLARAGERYVVIPVADIIAFLSESGLTKLCTRDREYWMDPTLNDLETRLDTAHFFRISRAALVRLDEIKEVAPLPGGSGQVTLKSGRREEVSRRRFRELLDRLAT
ncbi:LytR/AlgR family response regulator transcription factor [Paludibaculum fermentans]|uniref:LytR/AlgR family response regulator transcription factor n=1 Tax=Paludibaculum fermentans TaxID=1473598 RepID=UPI003EBF7762